MPAPATESCLYVGRFQPLHIGHFDVLTGLAARYGRVIVAISNAHVSHTPKDPLTGGERYSLLRTACAREGMENVDIVPIPVDPLPTTWVPVIATLCPKFDCVYGRNPMHAALFEHWGYPTVTLDHHARPTSGTAVRELMATGRPEWRTLVPESIHLMIQELQLEKRLRRLAIDPNT
jgi:nicotinamide-nucleotide adenylyltransferase